MQGFPQQPDTSKRQRLAENPAHIESYLSHPMLPPPAPGGSGLRSKRPIGATDLNLIQMNSRLATGDFSLTGSGRASEPASAASLQGSF